MQVHSLKDVRTKVVDGQTYFYVTDLLALAGYSVRSVPKIMERAPEEEVLILPMTVQATGVAAGDTCQERRKFVSGRGAKVVLSTSRKPGAKDLLKQLGGSIAEPYVAPAQASVEGKLRKVFGTHEIDTEVACEGYRIDVVFPEFDLAIEIDENGHDHYDEDEEKRRQQTIEEQDYEVLRYDPDSEPIEELYRKVYNHLAGH